MGTTEPLESFEPGEGMGRQRRRRLPVIDRQFQWKYAGMMALVVVALGGTMALLVYQGRAENTELLLLGDDSVLRGELERADRMFFGGLLLGILLMGSGLLILGIVVTHRISGPVHLLARHLGVLAEGGYPVVRPLRKKDEFREVFDSLQNAVEAMTTRDRERLRELDECLQHVRQHTGGGESLGEAVGYLQRERDGLASSLGRETSR